MVGGRYTEYWDTVGAASPGGTGRALGELGFDADLKTSAVFDYENPLWHIDGLRHLMTPTLSYRYIPDGDKSSAWIPAIDRSTFTNYLPIMELGDMRAVDQLQATNVLRFGLNNTLQTRDKTYGSRDLLTLNLAEDFRFQRAPGQTDFSDAHADMTATVTRWLSTQLRGHRLHEEGLPARPRHRHHPARGGRVDGALRRRVPLRQVRDLLRARPRLQPDRRRGHVPLRAPGARERGLRGLHRGDYDARDHLFVDQYYGVDRKISNTWDLEAAVVFSSGPNNNQGHFGMEVGLNLLRF